MYGASSGVVVGNEEVQHATITHVKFKYSIFKFTFYCNYFTMVTVTRNKTSAYAF